MLVVVRCKELAVEELHDLHAVEVEGGDDRGDSVHAPKQVTKLFVGQLFSVEHRLGLCAQVLPTLCEAPFLLGYEELHGL